jgi:hypothetical protein
MKEIIIINNEISIIINGESINGNINENNGVIIMSMA